MLINRLLAIFCLATLIFFVVGLCLASANPESERSQKWSAIVWGMRWIILPADLVLFVIWLIVK